MTAENKTPEASAEAPPRRPLTPEAQRALEEADERRRARDAEAARSPKLKEYGGREGPDPARYGDWEHGGIISDF